MIQHLFFIEIHKKTSEIIYGYANILLILNLFIDGIFSPPIMMLRAYFINTSFVHLVVN